MNEAEVGRFFDQLTSDYTATIERCFPRYREMLWAVLDYLPPSRRFESILELGCGTGNLSVLLRMTFPDAKLRLVDISGESLEVCRSRFGTLGSLLKKGSDPLETLLKHWEMERSERVRPLFQQAVSGLAFDQQDFGRLDYDNESFDLVVSSIAIHHLDSAGKQSLFRRVKDWLSADGVFCFADQCAGATDDLYARHIRHWKELSFKAGSSDAEWDMWMRHQADHDHHDTLPEQLDWLRAAGFSIVDCPWRYLLWSVIQARK